MKIPERFRKLISVVVFHFFAGFITAVTTALLFYLREELNTSTISLIYLVPVLLSTTLWGLGPGLLAGLIGFLSFNYFFIQPYYTFKVHETQDLTALIIFFLLAVLINQLVGRAKQNLLEAMDREDELSSLYEFSRRLAGVNDPEEIAAVIGNQIRDVFGARCVEVKLNGLFDENNFCLIVPKGARCPQEGTDSTALIRTSRGSFGEIRIWKDRPLKEGLERRMLGTFATQGAFALERAALAQAENRAKVLEESDRMKSALLSSVSHELRTPLAIIKASATSLLSEEVSWDTEARLDLLYAVDEETDHLNQLVGNLLDMSRIEAGALKPDRQWNMLSEIINLVIERMRRFTQGYQLDVDVSDDLPLVPVDFSQIERVFINLLSNSTKYAPIGSKIEIRSWLDGDQYLVTQLINQGPPVPETDLKLIFTKFYRITNADKITGTGLGLSICRGIIEAHGGEIWAENLPDGFSFFIRLPLTLDGRQPSSVESELE